VSGTSPSPTSQSSERMSIVLFEMIRSSKSTVAQMLTHRNLSIGSSVETGDGLQGTATKVGAYEKVESGS
jgi:preprotein translocase subunit YajC